ncbi:hypothetical protein MMC14_006014 [Varicellaria rhodocarpa]|nr:hypothetical protein [Varicellaria rhodocarpa]
MEVAGLVLGVVPLVIEVLKCYHLGKELADLFVYRKRHIDLLICALQGHEAVLQIILVWSLKTIDIYEPHNIRNDIPYLLQKPETIEGVRDFLGEEGSAAFQNAILYSHDAIQTIARNILGLLPEGDQVRKIHLQYSFNAHSIQVNSNTLATLLNKNIDDIKVQCGKGIKFAIKKK